VLADSHCHLTMEVFDSDREEALARAREAGVAGLLTVPARIGDSALALALARSHPGVWAAAGIHPHEAGAYTDSIEQDLERLLDDPLVVAVGEIGLDYHYEHSPREAQREAFRRQLRLALKRRRPIVIHTREASEETVRILEEEAPPAGGVFHCFSSGARTAAWALENGYYISFSGVLTFKNADDLRRIARDTPLDRTLIETDAPYLAPRPVRGQRNEPAHVRHVAVCLSEIHGVSAADAGRITASNFERLFGVELAG